MKILKIAIVVVLTIMIINLFQMPVNASTGVQNFDSMRDSIRQFLSVGSKKGSQAISGNDIKSVIIPIANILTIIGVMVLVGATIIMGIKYLFATPEQAAKLKQQLIGLVVSAVVVFGAIAIWKLVYNLIVNSGL